MNATLKYRQVPTLQPGRRENQMSARSRMRSGDGFYASLDRRPHAPTSVGGRSTACLRPSSSAIRCSSVARPSCSIVAMPCLVISFGQAANNAPEQCRRGWIARRQVTPVCRMSRRWSSPACSRIGPQASADRGRRAPARNARMTQSTRLGDQVDRAVQCGPRRYRNRARRTDHRERDSAHGGERSSPDPEDGRARAADDRVKRLVLPPAANVALDERDVMFSRHRTRRRATVRACDGAIDSDDRSAGPTSCRASRATWPSPVPRSSTRWPGRGRRPEEVAGRGLDQRRLPIQPRQLLTWSLPRTYLFPLASGGAISSPQEDSRWDDPLPARSSRRQRYTTTATLTTSVATRIGRSLRTIS